MKRALLWCGVVGAVWFVAVFLIEGATREGYDPMRHPISSLSLGHLGWMQQANFLITGLLFLAFAFGLRGNGLWLPVLMGAVAIGLIGAGLFATDPVNGYPPGAVAVGSTAEILHGLFSLLVFVGLPAACGVATRRFAKAGEKGWALYSAATAVAFLVFFFLAGQGFSGDPSFVPVGGLMQRITIVIGWAWIAALALHLLRRVPKA
jgi:hypothetical protein